MNSPLTPSEVLADNTIFTLQCTFPGITRTYTYLTRDRTIREGDTVVVDTPKQGLTSVTVKQVHHKALIDPDAKFSYKFAEKKETPNQLNQCK